MKQKNNHWQVWSEGIFSFPPSVKLVYFPYFSLKKWVSHSLGRSSFFVIYPAMYTRVVFISLERDASKFSRLSNISEPSSQSL